MNGIFKIVLIIALLFPISVGAECAENSVKRDVYSQIYDYVKVGFSEKEVVVSYEIEDTDLFHFFSNRLAGHQKEIVEKSYLEKSVKLGDDQYDSDLYDLFSTLNQRVTTPDYELWFSYPLGNMIICTVYPYGKRDAVFGETVVYLFCYDDNGIVNEMFRNVVTLN